MYNEGSVKTGALPEQLLVNFRNARELSGAIRRFGEESLIAARKSQAFVSSILTGVMPPGTISKFLGSPDVNFYREERSLSRTYLSTRQMPSALGKGFIFFWDGMVEIDNGTIS